jgi:small nuclear ribonucleoprotein (snRNP)-like protein
VIRGISFKILHHPVDVDPSGPIDQMITLLRISLSDVRVFLGTFTASDKLANVVFTDMEEYFRDQIRKLPMVIIPLNFVETIETGQMPMAGEFE